MAEAKTEVPVHLRDRVDKMLRRDSRSAIALVTVLWLTIFFVILAVRPYMPPGVEPVCWIAAHAFEHGFPVVTTDRDFRRVPGLRVHLVTLPREMRPGPDMAERATGAGPAFPAVPPARPEARRHPAQSIQEKRRPACAGRL